MIVSVMIFYVWERIAIYERMYQINRLKATVSELSNADKALEIAYYKLTDYSRIEKLAKTNLGLVNSDNLQVILVGAPVEKKAVPAIPEHITAYNKRRNILARIMSMSKAYAR